MNSNEFVDKTVVRRKRRPRKELTKAKDDLDSDDEVEEDKLTAKILFGSVQRKRSRRNFDAPFDSPESRYIKHNTSEH